MQEDIKNLPEDGISGFLRSGCKTTKVMDYFYHSEKNFLILREVYPFVFSEPYRWVNVSLIISKSVDCPKIEESCPTMTEIKRISSLKQKIYADDTERVLARVPERMRPLTSGILDVLSNESITESDETFIFKVPFRIGGQTYDDQTGYGSYYEGDDCIYEGTYYGQTTSFYVVGIIVNME